MSPVIGGGRLSRAIGSLARERDDLSLTLLLTLPAALLYGTTIIAWHLAVGEDLIGIMGMTDIGVYRYRGEQLLAGGMPYIDFYSESPPLMIYLLAVPQAMGGSLVAYAAYLSAIAILTSLTVFHLLRPLGRKQAFLSAALLLYNPATLATAAVFVQDEVIVALFYLLPLLLFARGRGATGVAVAALGSMVKLFSAALLPLGLRGTGLRRVAVATGSLLAAAVPFLLLAGEEFVRFPEYYLEQAGSSEVSVGISAWKFLADLGLPLPGLALSGTMVAATLLTYFIIWRRSTDPVVAGYLIILPFMLLFPKLIKSYLLLPVGLLAVLGARDEKHLWTGIAVFSLGYLASGFVTPKEGEALFPNEGAWALLPLAMVLGMDLLLLLAARRLLRDDTG